jgi:hypothetical protein
MRRERYGYERRNTDAGSIDRELLPTAGGDGDGSGGVADLLRSLNYAPSGSGRDLSLPCGPSGTCRYIIAVDAYD